MFNVAAHLHAVYDLIPADHWKIIIDAFCQKDLMDINDSVMEGSRTGIQIHIPHPEETFIEHFPLFLYMLVEVVCPAQKRLIVMKTEIFHIHGMEIILSQAGENLPQARDRSARENLFFDPEIPGMLF